MGCLVRQPLCPVCGQLVSVCVCACGGVACGVATNNNGTRGCVSGMPDLLCALCAVSACVTRDSHTVRQPHGAKTVPLWQSAVSRMTLSHCAGGLRFVGGSKCSSTPVFTLAATAQQ